MAGKLVTKLGTQGRTSVRYAWALQRARPAVHANLCRSQAQWTRYQSSSPGGRAAAQHFWTTGRVLLFTAFTASLTYALGVADLGAGMRRQGKYGHSGSHSHSYASPREMAKAIAEIRNVLGEDGISTDEDELHRHGFSEFSFSNIDTLPNAVAYPRSTDDVSRIAKICNHYKVPISPFSGGTSLEGNFSTPFGGLSIDFMHMNQVLAVHADDMNAVVQPAVPWMDLNDKLKGEDLFFPVDPGPTAQFGGMVGTGCSGTNAVRYGTMRDWVVNLTVVLADGTVIKTRRRPKKSSAGYNLTNLFVGSEGTLGLVTEITVKLAAVPQETSVAVVTFPKSLQDAAQAAVQILRAGIPVAAMELMDEVHMRIVNESGSTQRKWQEVPTIFFKFSGTTAGVNENIKHVQNIAKRCNADRFEMATSEREKADLWSARKNAYYDILATKPENQSVWGTDVAVPVSQLPHLINVTKQEMSSLGIFASALGHIGDGNFHATLLYDKQDPVEREKAERCVKNMVDRAIEMDGTCTGEHGVGIGKKAALVKELGPETIEIMRIVKRALDPNLIMNPGHVIDV